MGTGKREGFLFYYYGIIWNHVCQAFENCKALQNSKNFHSIKKKIPKVQFLKRQCLFKRGQWFWEHPPECSQGGQAWLLRQSWGQDSPPGKSKGSIASSTQHRGQTPEARDHRSEGAAGQYWRMTVGGGEEQARGREDEGALQTWHHLPGVSHRPNSPGHGDSATWASVGSHPNTVCSLVPR